MKGRNFRPLRRVYGSVSGVPLLKCQGADMATIWMLLILLPGHVIMAEFANEADCQQLVVKLTEKFPAVAAKCFEKPVQGLPA